MPSPGSLNVNRKAPTFLDRVRARWLMLARGPTRAWLEAVDSRDIVLASLLHEMGASAEKLDASAIIKAVEMKGAAMLELLLDSKARPNQKEREGMLSNPLQAAALSGNKHKVRMLVQAGANVDIKGNLGFTPLAAVLSSVPSTAPALPGLEEKRDMVFCLLEEGASAKGWAFRQRESMLRLAPLDLEIMDRLVLAGANPNRLLNPTPAKGYRPLDGEQQLVFRAIEIHCLREMAEFLTHLSKKPYCQGPHTRGRQGRPLLFEMVRSWAPPIPGPGTSGQAQWDGLLDLLVAHGHSMTATDAMGNTVLHAWAQAMAPSFYDSGRALLARPQAATLLDSRNKAGQRPVDILVESQGRLDSIPGGWRLMAQASQEQMDHVLPSATPVRTFRQAGRF